jgi:hypothetical protein
LDCMPQHVPDDLDNGPMRFSPPYGVVMANSTSIRHLIEGFDTERLQVAFLHLQQKWQERQHKKAAKATHSTKKVMFDLTPQWHCRYLWAFAKQSKCDGSYSFSVEKAFAAEKKLHMRYVGLNIGCMRQQIRSKVGSATKGMCM